MIGLKIPYNPSPNRKLSVSLLTSSNSAGSKQGVCSFIIIIAKADHFAYSLVISWSGIQLFDFRFKWSLFKTLEFLNSRKEDVEL